MSRWMRFVRFNTVGAAGVGVQLAAVWLLAEVAHVHYLLATPAAVALAVVHNFIWHRRWTWYDRDAAGVFAAFVRFAVANGALSLAGNLGVMATLVSGAHVEPVLANGVAISVCGLLNFWLGDTVVFRRASLHPPLAVDREASYNARDLEEGIDHRRIEVCASTRNDKRHGIVV
jgi:putative flippase GtrA